MTLIIRKQTFLLFVLVLSILSTLVNTLTAQQFRDNDLVDKIEAIVGREIVLKSEIDGQLMLYAQQDKSVNITDPAWRKRVMEVIINDKLLYTKAIEDSIQISDEEVNQNLEMTLAQMVAQVGSEQRLEEVYQKPMSAIKREGREEVRKRMMTERVRQFKIGEIKATNNDVELFYKEYKDSLPKQPTKIEIAHIVKYIVPSTESKDATVTLAKKLRDSIVTLNKDFADFAKRYSADPGSANSGGDLGMRKPEIFVPEFSSAAKRLQVGEVSQPIESPFGYHIIQLMDKNKDEIHTRHILLKITQSNDDVERVKRELDTLRKRILKKDITFEEAARLFSEEKQTQGFGGYLGKVAITALDPAMKSSLESLKDGEMTEPLPYSSDRTKQGMHLLIRKNTITEHTMTLETDYKEIEQITNGFKQQKEIADWIQSLRSSLYWEIKQ